MNRIYLLKQTIFLRILRASSAISASRFVFQQNDVTPANKYSVSYFGTVLSVNEE